MPSHYLNQCWVNVNWSLRNKLQWNLNQNKKLFIQENAFEIIVCQNGSHVVQGEVSYTLCIHECSHTVWVSAHPRLMSIDFCFTKCNAYMYMRIYIHLHNFISISMATALPHHLRLHLHLHLHLHLQFQREIFCKRLTHEMQKNAREIAPIFGCWRIDFETTIYSWGMK